VREWRLARGYFLVSSTAVEEATAGRSRLVLGGTGRESPAEASLAGRSGLLAEQKLVRAILDAAGCTPTFQWAAVLDGQEEARQRAIQSARAASLWEAVLGETQCEWSLRFRRRAAQRRAHLTLQNRRAGLPQAKAVR